LRSVLSAVPGLVFSCDLVRMLVAIAVRKLQDAIDRAGVAMRRYRQAKAASSGRHFATGWSPSVVFSGVGGSGMFQFGAS